MACDLTDEASPPRLVDAAVQRYGRLDIVINNAGIIQVGPVQAAQLGADAPAQAAQGSGARQLGA